MTIYCLFDEFSTNTRTISCLPNINIYIQTYLLFYYFPFLILIMLVVTWKKKDHVSHVSHRVPFSLLTLQLCRFLKDKSNTCLRVFMFPDPSRTCSRLIV